MKIQLLTFVLEQGQEKGLELEQSLARLTV